MLRRSLWSLENASLRERDKRPGQGSESLNQFNRIWASKVAQMVKHLPAMQKTWVRSLGWEDPLEKEMATYSSSLA